MAFEFLEPAALQAFRASNPGALLIDVRDRDMHGQLRLADSICVPLEELQARNFSDGLAAALDEHADLKVQPGQSVMLVCQLGRRAVMAAQFLEAQIDNPLFVLSGGVSACQEGDLEMGSGAA